MTKDYNIFDDMGIFDPNMAARSFGPHVRFKGGGGTPKMKKAYTERMSDIESEIYPMVEHALDGNGYGTDETVAQRTSSLYSGLGQSYAKAKGESDSTLNRTVRSNDSRVKSYVDTTLANQYISAKDNLRRQIKTDKYNDKVTAMGQVADYLANERGMTMSNANAYNNASAQNAAIEQQYGTFATNVAGGVGSGLTDAYFAKRMSS